MARLMLALFSLCLLTPAAFAGEADLKVPSLTQVQFDVFGTAISPFPMGAHQVESPRWVGLPRLLRGRGLYPRVL